MHLEFKIKKKRKREQVVNKDEKNKVKINRL